MKNLLAIFAILAGLTLTACAPTDTMNQYSEADVGRETTVEFGRIVRMREVKVRGQNTGTGAVIGGTAGGLAGSAIGNGNGQVAGVIGGLLIGAIAGGIAEQEMKNRKGIEYTITKRSGKTVTIVQNIAKDDVPLQRGARVMIQTSGQYMRVLPAEDLPDAVKKPHDIKVVD